MEYEHYFNVDNDTEDCSMDAFIAEAMRTDIRFNTDKETIDYLKASRITLKNEVLTCYEFLKSKGLLSDYHIYRDGE